MTQRWRFLSVVAVSLSAACSGAAQQSEPGAQASQAGAPGPRHRPRHRAVARAMDDASARATGCLPPAVTAGLTVEGAFVGPTGEFRVQHIESPQPIGASVRTCVRESFEQARVDPFVDAEFAVTHSFGAQAADAGSPSVAVATNTPSTASDAGTAPSAPAETATTTAPAPVATAPAPVVPAPVATTPTPPAPVANTPPVAPAPVATTAPAPPSTTAPLVSAGPIPASAVVGCYRGAIRTEPTLAGRIRLQFVVNPDGVTRDLRIAQFGPVRGRPGVFTQTMHCIEQRVRQYALPRSASGQYDLLLSLVPRNAGEISIERNGGGLTTTAPGTEAIASGANPEAPARDNALGSLSGEHSVATASSGLDMNEVAIVVRGRVRELTECYRTQLQRDPALQMRLNVRFGVEANGSVASASTNTTVLAGNSDVADDVARCVEGIVRTTTFPSHAGGVMEARLPFNFAPSAAGGAGASPSAPAAIPTEAMGRVDAPRLTAAVRANTAALYACYTRARANDARLAGRVVLHFVITPAGTVTNVSSQSQASAGDPSELGRVGHCLEGVMLGLTLPAPTGGPAAVALPFDFGSPTP